MTDTMVARNRFTMLPAQYAWLGMLDPLDVPARPRWPLDEAAALASPTHTPGRKGAKA